MAGVREQRGGGRAEGEGEVGRAEGGRAKAAVFPLPVGARQQMSMPFSAGRTTCTCTGVGIE